MVCDTNLPKEQSEKISEKKTVTNEDFEIKYVTMIGSLGINKCLGINILGAWLARFGVKEKTDDKRKYRKDGYQEFPQPAIFVTEARGIIRSTRASFWFGDKLGYFSLV